MSKFKFRRGELDKIDKLINSFNRKVDKLKNSNYNSEFLPEKMKYKNVVENIIKDDLYSRNDLKDQLQIMESFLKKDSEKILNSTRGLQIPKFKKREIEIKVKAVNRERARIQKEYSIEPLTKSGEILEEPEENKKNYNLHKIKPLKFNYKNMSRKELEMKEKVIANYSKSILERNEKYRKNYYKSLEHTSTPEDYAKLKKILDTLPTTEIIKKYYTDTDMDIKENYEPSEYEGRMEVLINGWNITQQDYFAKLGKEDKSK